MKVELVPRHTETMPLLDDSAESASSSECEFFSWILPGGGGAGGCLWLDVLEEGNEGLPFLPRGGDNVACSKGPFEVKKLGSSSDESPVSSSSGTLNDT